MSVAALITSASITHQANATNSGCSFDASGRGATRQSEIVPGPGFGCQSAIGDLSFAKLRIVKVGPFCRKGLSP